MSFLHYVRVQCIIVYIDRGRKICWLAGCLLHVLLLAQRYRGEVVLLLDSLKFPEQRVDLDSEQT